MIRLLFTDVDGTLVGSGGVVHPRVWETAERLRAEGIHLAICSGRPGFGLAREYASRLDPDGWHVFQNGASALHFASGRSLSTPLAPDVLRMLLERAQATGRVLELYSDSEYAVESESERAREHAALLGVPFRPRPLLSLEGPIVRAQWLMSLADEPTIINEVLPGIEASRSTSPVMPDTLFVNMTMAGVDKSSAVRAVADAYDVSLNDVMFVGDGQNDAAAMRLVGHPVAMANAEREAIAASTRIVAHVDEGGLADAMAIALASRTNGASRSITESRRPR